MATKQFQNAKLNVTHLDLKDDASRSVLQSGENISHSLGKIARWYKDIIWTDSKATTEVFGIVKLSDDYKSESTETVPTSKTLNDVVKLIKQTGGWNTTYDFNSNIEGDENLQNGQFKVTEHDIEGDIDHYVSIKGLGSAAFTDSNEYATSGHTHLYAGSDSVGGAATSANKLNTDAGSDVTPIYFSNGIPVACTYSLNSTVPSDAVFTDTTYTIESGDSNGQIKVTPSVGDPYNVSVKGLGSAAFTDSDEYATAGHTHNYAGSSTAGGVANSAAKLSDIPAGGIGSETKPVFFSGTTGRPIACTYSLNTTVPANAIFTDEKVKQSPVTTDGSFEVLFAGSTSNTEKTEGVGKTTTLTFNPSTGALSATSFSGNGSGLTSLNASNISSGTLSVNRLPGSAVTVGTYGPAAGGTLSHSGTFDVPDFTVDAKGRITGAHTRTFTLPAQYTHPTHTSKASGLYKITVDSLGHVSGTAAVTKSDIPALDYVSSTTTRNPNVVLAGPASGTTAAAPTFRALVAADLPSSGATAGSYGPSANATPGYGATFNVPYITVDAKGRVTGIENKTVKIPASDNTNTTYTLSGAYGSSSNTWVTTLTPSSGSATTSTVPTGSTSAYGLMKLYNGVDSTSTALAATANAVKTAYDKANHSHPYVKIRDNGYSYNNLASFYNGSTLKSYIRITVPKGSSTWTMCTLEITLKANYSSGLYGKILFHGNWSSSSDWNNLKAEITHNLGTGIKMYASDKTYIYISGHGSYATCTVDKMTIGDNAVNYDLSAVTIDQVDSLPSTYQTVSMTYYANYSVTGHTHTKSQITDFPSSLKNPNALTVQGNGTTSISYDGSVAKTLNIKPGTGISVSSDTSGNITITNTSTNTDTKNTAGSTNTSSKIFLIGATSQAANPQTYSHDTVYVGTDGCLYSNSTKVSVEGHTHSYLPLAGGTMTGDIIFDASHGIVQHQRSDSNYTSAITWLKGGTSQATYDPQISQHNTGDTNGSITILPYPTDTSPWSSSVGLYISKTRLLFNGTSISLSGHTHNYAGSSSAGGVANSAAKLSTARTINGVKFDGTADIIVPRSIKHIHYANGTNGSSGYVKICTVGTNAAYGDQPIRITIGQRRISVYDIFIVFENSGSAKATIRDAYFRSNRLAKQSPEVHYYLNSNGYYDIYVKKTEGHDHIFIMDYLKSDGDEGDNIALTWTNTLVSTLPSGSVKMLNEMDKYYLSTISRGANTVLAAPNGSAGSATFRALVAADLPASGATAGSYGPSANATPGYGSTFNVPYITVDAKGRVTAISTKTVKIPASDNTNTTYTFATGDNNGTFKVTPSGGTATNIAIKGLGSAAYTASSAYATASHTHNYAGSSTAGGPATLIAMARVTKDSKVFPGQNRVKFEEYTAGDSYNLPTNAWYHIISMQGSDTRYGTQIAIGMTANKRMYFRNYNESSWQDWTRVSIDGHTHSYLPLAGGTMTGNIEFGADTSTTYPAESKGIVFSGSTDGASIFYRVTASDQGELVIKTRDDGNCIIRMENSTTNAKNTIKFDPYNSYIYANYFNAGCGAETPTTSSYIIYANSDGWLRKSTLANIKTILGLGSAAYTASSAYATSGHAHGLGHSNFTVAIDSTTNTWAAIGVDGTNKYVLKSIHTNTNAPPYLLNDFSAGIVFGGEDTRGVISMKYDTPSIRFAGGNRTAADGGTAKWYITLTGTHNTTYNLDTMHQVTQTATTTSAAYEVLFSGTADNTTRTEGARKNSNLTFNPSTGVLTTDRLYSAINTGTYLAGNTGSAIINSTASAGAYVMLARMHSTNGYFTHGTCQSSYLLQYTVKSTIDAGTNAVTKSVTLLNESGNSSFPGTVTATTFSGSGASLTSLNASNISSGTLSADRLATSGVTAGSYGPSTNASPAHSGTFNVPYITVDNKGRVMSIATRTITLPASGNTDTKVTQSATSTANFRGVILGTNNTSNTGDNRETTVTGQGYITNKIFAQPSTGNLYASNIYAFANGTDEVRITLYRSGNSSWRFVNNGGTLSLQNNYYNSAVQSWYNVAQFEHSGTNAIKLMTPPQLTGTNRSTTYGYSTIDMAICSKDSWAMSMRWLNNARNAVRGSFGAYGTADNLTYYYWGNEYNATKLRLYPGTGGGLVSQQSNGFRIATNGYGVIFRVDSDNFYILLTDKKTDGSELTGDNWNSKRPLQIGLSSGVCNINGTASTAKKLKYCTLCNEASDAATYPWYRMAYAYTTGTYVDLNLVMMVTCGYGSKWGIFKARARIEGKAGTFGGTVTIEWIVNNGFTDTQLYLLTKNNYQVDTAKSGTATAEIWFKSDGRYWGYTFTVLHEGWRTSTASDLWALSSYSKNGSENYNKNASGVKSATSSKIYSTNTPGSSSHAGYSIPFFSGPIDSSSPEKNDTAASGNKTILHNGEFRLGLLEGTTSTDGYAQLVLGNGIASGTAGNKYGKITLYSSSAYAVQIIPANVTGTRTLTLPNASGTVALTSHTHSYIPTSSAATLFSGTAAASITMTSMSGYTRLVVFCKNTSNSSYFTVELQCTTGYHYHAMTISPPPAAQTSNSFYGLLFNLSSNTKLSVSAGKYSNLSSSASLANGPTVHITKVIGYKF